MDAHYDFQIRQQHQQSTFHGPARQFGSGGMGAFALRMGRVAMPLVEKYVLPVAEEFAKNLSFFPNSQTLFLVKKRPRKAVGVVLKPSANKTIAKAVETRDATAGAKRRERAGDRATPARKKVKDGNKSSAGIPRVAKKRHFEKEYRQEKSVRYFIQNQL